MWLGASPKRQAKASPAEPLYNTDVCHNSLSMKNFHGASAGNPHVYSLKLSLGKVRVQISLLYEQVG